MFGFPKKATPVPSALPPLKASEVAVLTLLVKDHLESLGESVTCYGDGMVKTTQSTFGLHNLAQHLHNVPSVNWPEQVEQHVNLLLEANSQEVSDVTADQVFLKLRSLEDIPETPTYDSAEPLPGLHALMAIDYPESVTECMTMEDLAHLGTWEELQELALANLKKLPLPNLESVRGDDELSDSTIHVLMTDDFFGASRFLILNEILRVLGIDQGEHGIFVSVPNRHLLIIHPLQGKGVISAVGLMASITRGESAASGPLSPNIFYINPQGIIQTALTLDEEHKMRMVVEGKLADEFLALGLLGNP